ncbi:MAG: hypothetical protein A4E19_20775 [Nitrospira sp. SG-bin1]|nr:MAG: hypothetical protein A4E19_20775 [Nitrospira sp. SG-bin1]
MPDQMTELSKEPVNEKEGKYFGGAVGAGLALVVLPCVALYYGIDEIGRNQPVGLPILAIFGIMILFGALALISTLFARLKLHDPSQPLALPEGSIRAAIALSLIVLFAIISIMLFQSDHKPYVIPGVEEQALLNIVKIRENQVIAIVPERCASSSEPCGPEDRRFSVHIRPSPTQESTDLAKQLLILIGTLMTSVTSFYFASRAAELKRKDEEKLSSVNGSPTAAQASQSATSADPHTMSESHMDACEVPITNATPDDELPPAKGGVA